MRCDTGEPWNLAIGRVVAPFGIKGQVRVRAETDSPERFDLLKEVCLEMPDGEQRMARIAEARVTHKGVVLHFEGCHDRDRANELRGAWIMIRPSMALPLPEGSHYLHQIIGLHVYTTDGRDLGEVTEVIQSPANDVYVTPQAMIPALRQVVREIDIEERKMIVELPPEESAKDAGP